jgi:hypothetical protein
MLGQGTAGTGWRSVNGECCAASLNGARAPVRPHPVEFGRVLVFRQACCGTSDRIDFRHRGKVGVRAIGRSSLGVPLQPEGRFRRDAMLRQRPVDGRARCCHTDRERCCDIVSAAEGGLGFSSSVAAPADSPFGWRVATPAGADRCVKGAATVFWWPTADGRECVVLRQVADGRRCCSIARAASSGFGVAAGREVEKRRVDAYFRRPAPAACYGKSGRGMFVKGAAECLNGAAVGARWRCVKGAAECLNSAAVDGRWGRMSAAEGRRNRREVSAY